MQSIERGRPSRDASRVRAYARSERGRKQMEALLEACRAYALEQGYGDVPATGDVGRRLIGTADTRLAELLEAVARGEVDRLFVSHIGALGWEPDQVHAVMDRLADAGVAVDTLRDGPVGLQASYLLAYSDLREPPTGKVRKPAPSGRARVRRPR